jgi:regulator of RNase E activity RraA
MCLTRRLAARAWSRIKVSLTRIIVSQEAVAGLRPWTRFYTFPAFQFALIIAGQRVETLSKLHLHPNRLRTIELMTTKAVSPSVLDLLTKVSTATLTSQMFRRGFRNIFIQGATRLTIPPTGNLVGPAYTMRNIPAREDLDHIGVFADPEHPQRKGVESIPPGHVLVIDCRGEKGVASGGEILTTRLWKRGVAGIVSDGPVRDSHLIAKMAFPVYCAGAAPPLNLGRHHAVDLNVPIGCGGVPVYPGDIIVGDEEGVVVIPQELAEEVAADAWQQEQIEEFIIERVRDGAALPGTYPPNEATKAAYEEWRKQRGQV